MVVKRGKAKRGKGFPPPDEAFRRKWRTGEFQDWLTPEQRQMVADVLRKQKR